MIQIKNKKQLVKYKIKKIFNMKLFKIMKIKSKNLLLKCKIFNIKKIKKIINNYKNKNKPMKI